MIKYHWKSTYGGKTLFWPMAPEGESIEVGEAWQKVAGAGGSKSKFQLLAENGESGLEVG